MASQNILILLGYDYTHALEGILGNEHIFCFLYSPYQKYFTPENLSLLKKLLGDRLTISTSTKDTIPNIIQQRNISSIVTLGWRKLIDVNDYKDLDLLINVHPALLPEYKGYHPVPYVILNEEKEHGITAHLITEEMDAGDIVLKKTFALNPFSTLKSLQYEVNKLMPEFLDELFEMIFTEKIEYSPNKDADTKIKAPGRTPEDSEVSISAPLEEVFKKVKAADSDRFPAYFIYEGEKVFINMYRAKEADRQIKFDI